MKAAKCTHTKDHVKNPKPGSHGCEECLKIGGTWVHLRMCMECGKVGCCDSSRNRQGLRHVGLSSIKINATLPTISAAPNSIRTVTTSPAKK
jgi:hypothetical protein